MAWHFHFFVFNMPWNDVRDVEKLWNRGQSGTAVLGFVFVSRRKRYASPRHAANYLAKYVSKDLREYSLTPYQHLYDSSNSCDKPEQYSNPENVWDEVPKLLSRIYWLHDVKTVDLGFVGTGDRYIFSSS